MRAIQNDEEQEQRERMVERHEIDDKQVLVPYRQNEIPLTDPHSVSSLVDREREDAGNK